MSNLVELRTTRFPVSHKRIPQPYVTGNPVFGGNLPSKTALRQHSCVVVADGQ